MEGEEVPTLLTQLVEELETRTGGRLFLLEDPAASTLADMLACRHLLLPRAAGTLASGHAGFGPVKGVEVELAV